MKNSWEIKKLGEVCEVLDNKRKPITKRDRTSGKYPYYGATGVLDYVSDYIFNEKLILIGEDGAKWGAGENTAYAVEGKCWVNNHAHVIKPERTKVIDNWIIYLLNFSDLTQYITGLTVPKLNQEKMRNISFPLPPLPEQKRIVAILDKAFDSITKTKEIAEKNLNNSNEVFESYLQSVFANTGDGWEKKKLKQIGVTQTGTTPKTFFQENYGDFIPFVKPADIDIFGNGEIRYNLEGLSKKGLDSARKVFKNSILMVCIGASIGKVGFTDRDISCNQQINTLTLNNNLNSKFFYYALSSQTFRKQVILNSSQATLPIINKSKWENLLVSFPESRQKQESIAKKLDAFLIETKKLENISKQKLVDIEELRKSILQKAFNGEL